MRSPVQKELGHSPIAHPILEAMAMTNFTAGQYKVLHVVIRETYGWSRKTATISLTTFEDATRMHRNTVQRSLRSLVDAGVLVVVEAADFTRPATYQLQKDPREWGEFAVEPASLREQGQSPPKVSPPVGGGSVEGDTPVTSGATWGGSTQGNSHTSQVVAPQEVTEPQYKGSKTTRKQTTTSTPTGVSVRTRPKRSRETVLPDEWTPNETHVRIASEEGVALIREAEQFRDYHTAKGTTYRDWDAAFRTWLRNARKYANGGSARSPPGERKRIIDEQDYNPEPWRGFKQ